jgi:hypothetical protein
MSRLDSFIRRLQAQRSCLDWAAAAIAGRSGAVLELGLGNGRTYDHLRSRLGEERAIYAFDRQLAAHPACVPPSDRLLLGDLAQTLPDFAARRLEVVLAHADLGSGDLEATAALARWLGPYLAAIVAPEGLILSDQRLEAEGLRAEKLPPGVPGDRYFAYRRA